MLILALTAILAAQIQSETLALLCKGGGNRRLLYRSAEFQEDVEVEITAGRGRIRMPTAMLPPEMRGGKDGWWELRDFRQTETEYRASVRVNVINFPKISINRLTGSIRIDGGQSRYAGTCEKVDASKVKF